MKLHGMKRCPECGASIGEIHNDGCEIEICSVCGGLYHRCKCNDHDKEFARWSGIYPGLAEATFLGIDMKTFHRSGLAKKIFIKPSNHKDRRPEDGRTIIP